MKTFLLWVALLAALLLVMYPLLKPAENPAPLTGLPWQIEVLNDGSTQVFGLHIGASRLSDALDILGHDMELAIVAGADEVGSLEMYYGNYRAGLLSGRLILRTSSSEQKITAWRERALKSDYMASGKAKKYKPAADDLSQVLAEIITVVTFVPAVNLDADTIVARFGEPAERVQSGEATYFLYPEKGLDIALFEEANEVIQYVAPAAFQELNTLGE